MLRREVEGNKIKSKSESHSRGWQAPAQGLQREQGVAAADSEGPQARRATRCPGACLDIWSPWWPGWGVIGLAATWDHLGLFSSRTSGVAGRGEK